MGRRKAAVAQFVRSEGEKHTCTIDGWTLNCKQFPGTKMADHVYCDCPRATSLIWI